MDLREILQRRLKKKSSDEKKPDPPTSTSNEYNHNNQVELASEGTPPKVKPRVQEQQARRTKQPIELGTIQYCNITSDGRHGDYNMVLQVAAQHGDKPIFANFVEWSGWQGCQDAGRIIFSNPTIQRIVEEYFIPAAFNTWDRSNAQHNKAFRVWSSGLQSSWWGYLRIISNDGKTILSGTKQITGGHGLKDVIRCLREALEELDIEVPPELY